MTVGLSDRDEIQYLTDKVREIAETPKNTEKRCYWLATQDSAQDHWRGTPKPRRDLPRAPITVEPEITMWARILGFSVLQYYKDPVCYLKNYLKTMIYRYQNWDDDTPVDRRIPIWLGVTLESSLFGAKTVFAEDEYPWLDRSPVVQSSDDLSRLEFPDFHSSGLMPQAHWYYEVLRELLDDDFEVSFHEWGRSPFGVAFHIRGYEQLAIDMAQDPEFVHRLMAFITEARQRWTRERARFLGKDVEKGNLYNDEVNTPSLSPVMYEEYALPYEQELSGFHGGILYWHSCGDTSKLVERIAKIENLGMFHVGPWTDGAVCMRTFQGRVPLEFCLHPLRDVQLADERAMEGRVRTIARTCGGNPYTVRADGIQVVRGLSMDVEAISTWVRVADRALRQIGREEMPW